MPYIRTVLLLAALTGIFLVVGDLIAGRQGMIIAFLFALGMNLFAYWNSDRMVLSMYGAREVDEASAPQLYALVRDLAVRAGLPMPKIYMIENDQPNAFATGRDPQHAAVDQYDRPEGRSEQHHRHPDQGVMLKPIQAKTAYNESKAEWYSHWDML